MSSRGLYYARSGASPTELSDIIEPLFTKDTTGLILSESVTILSEKDEKVYIYIPSSISSNNDIVVVYDYYWKDWFKYKNIKARAGFVMINDVIFHIDTAGNIYQRKTAKNDNTAAITGTYSSGWWDMDSPSLRKKFIRFVLLSIGSPIWTANIKSQVDWVETDRTDENIPITATTRVEERVLNKHKNKSIRFLISNSTLDEEMLVTGYEFEFEWAGKKPKGDS